MNFKEELPIWNAEGIKPTDTVIDEGYSPGDKPPADWFNWNFNRTYLSLKEIRENIGLMDKDVDKKLEGYWGKDELEIGGRNLFPMSNRGWESEEFNIFHEKITVDWVVGELYTITLKGEFESGKTPRIWLNQGKGARFLELSYDKDKDLWSGKNTVTQAHILDFPRSISLFIAPQEPNSKSIVEWIKVEKGNIPTDWTPAPEDILEQAGKVKSVNKKTGEVVLTGTDIQLSRSNTSSIDTVLTNYMSKTDKEIDTVKQSGVESNKSLVEALNSKGVSASTNDNIKTNVSKVNQIDTDPSGNTTAVSGDLLQGKTAYSQKKQIVGTMPNVGSQRSAVTKDGYYVAIKEGYHDGTGRVTSRVENLKPDVIKKGEVVGGIEGTFAGQVKTFQDSGEIIKGDTKKYYVPDDGSKIVGAAVSPRGLIHKPAEWDSVFLYDNTMITGPSENVRMSPISTDTSQIYLYSASSTASYDIKIYYI